jgi:hypothetical protein
MRIVRTGGCDYFPAFLITAYAKYSTGTLAIEATQ